MKLLAPTPPAELPAEALLARVRSRRARLGSDLTAEPEPGTEADKALQDVLDWVYLRLDKRLRSQLRPYLQVLAMRLFELGLRYRMADEPLPDSLLQSRFLNPGLLDLLGSPADPLTLVTRVEAALVPDCPYAAGLGRAFRRQGPGAVETRLNNGVLQQSLAESRAGIVRTLIRCLIDTRNLLAVLRYWRWQTRIAPELVPGGTVSPEKLTRVWADEDRPRCRQLIQQVAKLPITTDQPREVERLLIRGLSRRLRRAGREPLGVAVILDYLWRQQLMACNRVLQRVVGQEQQELLTEALLT